MKIPLKFISSHCHIICKASGKRIIFVLSDSKSKRCEIIGDINWETHSQMFKEARIRDTVLFTSRKQNFKDSTRL